MNILAVCKEEEMTRIQGACKRKGYKFSLHHDPLKAIKDHSLTEPNIVFVDLDLSKLDCSELVYVIKQEWPEAAVIIISDNNQYFFIDEVFACDAFDYLRKPCTEQDVYIILEKLNYYIKKRADQKLLVQSLATSESRLQEKMTILETILDILSHDSKNLFLNIRALIKQLEDTPIRSMLEDVVNELYNDTMEAVGYLGAKKRVYSLVELVSNLKISKDRIPLSSYRRIHFSFSSRFLLYIESSVLIKNAITNLVENALKYSPGDADITVSLERDNEWVFIHVADQGIGIPDEEKRKVLERYYRRRQTKKVDGTGRGLWITRNIVEKEGGDLSVSDNIEGGSIFTIKLPGFKVTNLEEAYIRLVDWFGIPPDELDGKAKTVRTMLQLQGLGDAKNLESAVYANLLDFLRKERRDAHQHHFRSKLISFKKKNPDGKSILIVDDSLYVHYYLASSLTELGYRIADYARNGEEGVSFYNVLKPDLVTLDVTMPIMSGIEAAQHIYKMNPQVKILFLTGLGDHKGLLDDVGTIMPISNVRVLTKPYKMDKLEHALNELFDNV